MFGFLTKNHKHGLVYTGEISQYDKLMDSADAESRYRQKRGGEIEEIELTIYGETKRYKIPLHHGTDISTCTIITKQFNDFIREKAKYKMFSDISLGYWDEIIKSYECVVNDQGRVCFFDMEGTKKDVELRTVEEKADFVMLREYMGGYVRVDDYDYHYKDEDGKKHIIPTALHTNFNTGGLGIEISNNYTTWLRNAMFGRAKEMFESATLLQPRQYDVLEKMGHKTFVCGSRRLGKTYLCAFVCLREIMRNSFDARTSGRPLQVIYVANKSSVFSTVVQYIQGMCRSMGKDFDNMFRRDTTVIKGGKVLVFGSGKDALGRIVFASAKEDGVGLGLFADLIIIDEAGKVPKKVYENLMPIVYNERAKLLCISTMYVDSLKGWFFNEIIEAEKRNMLDFKQKTLQLYKDRFHGLKIEKGEANKSYQEAVEEFYDQNDTVACRYTIDDNIFMKERDKERMKEKTIKEFGMVHYYCELYSRFVDAGRVFEVEEAIVEKLSDVNRYKYMVLGYDPASLNDKPGVCVLGYDSIIKKVVVMYADYLTHDTGQYQEQITQIRALYSQYQNFIEIPENFYKVADSTQGGTIDAFEISNFFFDRRYRRTAGSDVIESKKIYSEYKIPKKQLIECSENAFVNNYIAIPQKMSKLIAEFDCYQRIEHSSGKIEYGAVGGNDDIVSAFMMALYYIYNEIGIKYEVSDHRIIEDVEGMSPEMIGAYNAMKLSEGQVRDAMYDYNKARENYFSSNVF